MKRRFFLFAAPAIVAAPSLMRVSAAVLPPAPLSGTLTAKYTWKQASVSFHLESNGVHDWWTRPAAPAGYARSDLLPLMRRELDQMHRALYADGNSNRHFGLAALLSDKEYAELADGADWDD